MWGMQHAIIEGVAFLMMQKGLGFQALFTTARVSVLWGMVCVLAELVNLAAPSGLFRNSVLLVWYNIMLVFYGVLWLAPTHKLFRRPAVHRYAMFWFVYRLCTLAVLIATRCKQVYPIGVRFSLTCA